MSDAVRRRPALSVPATARRVALIATAASGAGIGVAAIPSIAFEVAIVVAAGTALAMVMMIRADRVLDPAYVVIALIYLVGPVGTVLRNVGIGLSTVALVILVPIPFVLAALYLRPQARARIGYLAPLISLVALAALSLAWSPSPIYGLEKLGLWVLTGVLPAGFIVILASATSRVMWRAIALAAFLYAVILIGFGESTSLYPGQLALFGDNPIWTARAVFLGAIVVTFGPFPRVLKVVSTPIFIAAGILPGSLGPLVGFAAALWAGAAETFRSAARTTDRLGLGWIALGLVTGTGLVAVLSDAFFGGNASILAKVLGNDPNVSGRAMFLDASLRLFASAPVLGVGIGGFASTGLLQYPHNIVAEIGSELGVVGLLCLAAWFFLALRGAAGSPLLVALLVATSCFALFSGSVASNAEFWMCSALAIANLRVRSKKTDAAVEPIGTDARSTAVGLAAAPPRPVP